MRRVVGLFLLVCSPALAQDAMFRGNPQHTGSIRAREFLNLQKFAGNSAPRARCFRHRRWQATRFTSAAAIIGCTRWIARPETRSGSSRPTAASPLHPRSPAAWFSSPATTETFMPWRAPRARRSGNSPHQASGALPLHIFTGLRPSLKSCPIPSTSIYRRRWSRTVRLFGSGDTNIYALDAATGAVKWKFKTGDVVHGSPAISDGVVLIGSWDSFFYALDAATGQEKWRFKTGEDADIHNQVGIQSSPAVADGVVYFGCRDSKFYAVDLATGKQRWAYPNKGSWVIASPAVSDAKVYFATSDTGLFHAVDAKTGTEIFSFDNHHWPMFSSPAIAGGLAYIGSHQGKLLAIDLKTQKPAWTYETDARSRMEQRTPRRAVNRITRRLFRFLLRRHDVGRAEDDVRGSRLVIPSGCQRHDLFRQRRWQRIRADVVPASPVPFDAGSPSGRSFPVLRRTSRRERSICVNLVAGVDLGGTAINYTLVDARAKFLIEGLCEHPALSKQGPEVCLNKLRTA